MAGVCGGLKMRLDHAVTNSEDHYGWARAGGAERVPVEERRPIGAVVSRPRGSFHFGLSLSRALAEARLRARLGEDF
jgi:hypothetical protein